MKPILYVISLLTFLNVHHQAHGTDLASRTELTGEQTLIVTKGSGGDANGSSVLQDTWGSARPDLVNLSNSSPETIEISRYSCVLVVGQGAIHDIARSAVARAKLSGRTVGIYSHLIDSDNLNLIDALRGHSPLNLFFTNSQLSLLRPRNASGYELLQSEHKRTWLAPLAIETVSPQQARENEPVNVALAGANYVIWLGGNYIDSTEKSHIFTTSELVAVLKNLRALIPPGSSVAIMLIPRLFDAKMDRMERMARLVAIHSVFSSSYTTYYGSSSLVSDLESTDIPIRTAPSYATLMHLPWSEHTKHYASSDQFNLFIDFKQHLEPFLLDPTDADQAMYALDYVHAGHIGLTDMIRKHGCDGQK